MSDATETLDPDEIALGEAPAGPGILLCECFAGEGLQGETAAVPAEAAVAMVDHIAGCGFRSIGVTGLPHPGRRPRSVVLRAACPDPQAVRRALEARDAGFGPDEIVLPASATEGHSRHALGRTRDEQWAALAEMVALAGGAFLLAGSIAVAFDCPFDGPVEPRRVLDDAERFAALGVTRIAIGDTSGAATPPRVRDLIGWLDGALPTASLIAHFHDGRGTGLANTLAAIEAGLTEADCALGGAGGQPAGLTCTEDLVAALQAMGHATGLDAARLHAAGLAAERLLGRRLHSRTLRRDEDD